LATLRLHTREDIRNPLFPRQRAKRAKSTLLTKLFSFRSPRLYAVLGFARIPAKADALFRQLAGQTRLVAREFALPTTHGITLHLCFPDLAAQNPDSDPIPSFAASSSLSPSVDEHRHVSRLRLTDASWKVLWADHLEGRGAPEPIQGVNGLRESRQ
jgi:hypothetical protein